MPRITIGPTCWKVNDTGLGCALGSGFVICKAGGIVWIVSPISAEVSRTWHLRTDANTTAQAVSGCTGWFVPTYTQLQNPGYICRSFWGPSPCYSITEYWSGSQGTQYAGTDGEKVAFTDGNSSNLAMPNTRCVRAFRCVAY